MINSKGNSSVIIAVVGLVIVGVVGYFMFMQTNNSADVSTEDGMMEQVPANEESLPANETMMESEEGNSMSMYQGNILAGKETLFIEFNNADYVRAQEEGKIIFLDFYADWCPVCRAEAPDLHEGFDLLADPNVVGFRVNYNDSDTDEIEKALAEEFGVTYQHTKIVIRDGKVVLKDGEVWDTEDFLREVNTVI